MLSVFTNLLKKIKAVSTLLLFLNAYRWQGIIEKKECPENYWCRKIGGQITQKFTTTITATDISQTFFFLFIFTHVFTPDKF